MKKRLSFLVALLVAFLVMPTITVRASADTVDKWEVIDITNYIPFTPEGYSGTLVNYTDDYTGEDGVTVQKTYENVAFVELEDDTDYGEDTTYAVSEEINGELVQGRYLLKVEEMFFLEHTIGTKIERFYLNVAIPEDTNYLYIIEKNEETVLIEAGSTIFTYQFDTGSCEIITDSALDYKYPVGDTLYFTDWDHQENKCDWVETIKAQKTGKKVIAYWSDDFNLEIDTDFQEKFLEMQEAIKKGADENQYPNYSIYNNIYSVSNDEWVGNIHLPYAIKWNKNLFYTESDAGCWLVENNTLTLYRYGEVVRSYDLPKGNWRVIESYLSIHEDANSAFVKYIVDTNEDGIITPKELDASVTNTNILLLNATEHAIYTINSNGMITKVVTDVQDYCEAYGELYWMDSNFDAYELSWTETTESVLIGKNVVGISKHTDERAGFVVKPGDSRCNSTSDGFALCTMYGTSWLNQENTSGAWALEYEWE